MSIAIEPCLLRPPLVANPLLAPCCDECNCQEERSAGFLSLWFGDSLKPCGTSVGQATSMLFSCVVEVATPLANCESQYPK